MRTEPSRILGWSCVAAGLALALAATGFIILPFRQHLAETRKKVAETAGSLAIERRSIQRGRELEQETAEARGLLAQRIIDHGGDAATAWLPLQVQRHFKRIGLEATLQELSAVESEPGLPGYRRVSWRVQVPVTSAREKINDFLLAAAALEQQNRLIQMHDFAFQVDPANAHARLATMEISMLVRK